MTELTGSEPGAPAVAAEDDLPEQMRVRRHKRERILAGGGQAYPVESPRTHTLAQVRERWAHLAAGEETSDVVTR